MKESGDIVLIDFGLSKQYAPNGEPESSTKVGAGTPGYAPIEQANYREGKGFPITMDVYALGGTMFKMLTGVRPPEASDILNDGFPLYELQKRHVSENIYASIAKAMAPIKKDRYSTVDNFINSFEEEETVIDVEVASENVSHKEYPTEKVFKVRPNTSKVTFEYHPRTPIFQGSYFCSVNKETGVDTNITQESTHIGGKLNEREYTKFLNDLQSLNLRIRDKEVPPYRPLEYSESPSELTITLYDENCKVYNKLWISGWDNELGNIDGELHVIEEKVRQIVPMLQEYIDGPYYEIPNYSIRINKVNEDNEELLPIPDKGIFLEICNPTPGALSFQFYLNEEVCNTVIVYRDGKKILNEDYFGGIMPEVVDALRQNGLLSKMHWERESSTIPLDGMTVSCTFLYKNGYKFARQVKCAHPAYYHLLLDAIKNVFKVHELSQFINEALEKEFSYSCEDIENYGISMFSFMPDNEMLIYYRGNTYFCNKIDFYGIRNYSQINATFDDIKYNLQKSDIPKIDFDSYLRTYKNKIDNSFNIITYCRESDLLEILYKSRQNSSFCGRHRIVQEMQLLPLCYNNTKDEIVAYEYPHLYCETEVGEGVVEILQTGLIESKGDYTTENNIKKLSSFESIASLILSSIVQYHIIEKSWEDEGLLLSIVPFDIKAEIWINKRYRDGFTLIERNTLIPCKKSETISDDECTIVVSFLRKRFSIDVKELFRYKPKSIELVVDIDANTIIRFVFRDKEFNKKIFMSQTEIFNYEEKIYNEDTPW